ncbi:hypothetical protein P7K49_004159, partial [Saguinus oedipus]
PEGPLINTAQLVFPTGHSQRCQQGRAECRRWLVHTSPVTCSISHGVPYASKEP